MKSAKELGNYLQQVKASMKDLKGYTGKNFELAGFFLACSKVMQTVAFFMPLKVLIILSSEDGVAKYSQYLNGLLTDEEFFVLILALVPISYLLYIAFGILHRSSLDKSVQKLTEYAQDQSLNKKQTTNLKKLHNPLMKVWSDSFMATLIVAAITVLHPLFAGILALIILANLVLFSALVFDQPDSLRLTWFKLHASQFVEYMMSANYLLIFLVLAVGAMYSNVGILTSLFALLLSRLCLQAVQRISNESRTLKSKIEKYRQAL